MDDNLGPNKTFLKAFPLKRKKKEEIISTMTNESPPLGDYYNN